ncbi:hypothetical protein [Hydrogenimonas sp.]
MLDLILFGATALLLVIVIVFLVVIVRDHMKNKSSFEIYVKQHQIDAEKTEPVEEKTRKSRRKARERKKESSEKKEAPTPSPAPETKPEAKVETKPEREEKEETVSRKSPETPKSAEESPDTRSQTLYRLHPEEEKKEKGLPEELKKEYGPFTHRRLVEGMGLSEEEADEFVVELIHQLEEAIRSLDEAIGRKEYDDIEHITHGLKGAALNIGEGGVAELLTDYNTYMKRKEIEFSVVEAYQTLLKRTVSELKIEYSQVA